MALRPPVERVSTAAAFADVSASWTVSSATWALSVVDDGTTLVSPLWCLRRGVRTSLHSWAPT